MAKRHKRRKASPAQLRARKLFAERFGGKKRSKAKASRPKRSSRRRRKSPLGEGRHRPVVIKRSGKLYRPRRSTLPAHARLANPFLGGFAMIGNPSRKKRRKSSRRPHRRSGRSLARLSNPLPAVLAAPRQMASKEFVTEAASVAAGFVLPSVILPRLPIQLRDSTIKSYASKVAIVAVLAGGASLINKRVSRALLLGGGVSILLDVWTDFIAPAVMGATGAGVSAYYGDPGDPGVGTYFGNPGDPGVGASIADAFGGSGDGEAWG